MSVSPDRPAEGAVSWNINTACNYRCTYCTQRFKEDRARWSQDTPRFLEAFARLPGPWEIKLSGGEPFVHPTLTEIVTGLAGQERHISVVTNFSAGEKRLEAFLDAAGEQLRVFSCSLHLEYADPGEFLRKALWCKARLPRKASLNVTSVATRERLPQLIAVRERFLEAGVTFRLQAEKQNRDVIAYEPHERALLEQTGSEIAPNFQGRPCWAGDRYFILDDKGLAYRCYPARRYKQEFLGNFLDPGFRLFGEARPCNYSYCNCSVPISRKMMSRTP